jgi:hypothetical protein
MAKLTSSKSGNKTRSAVRGKPAAGRGAARSNDGSEKPKPVVLAAGGSGRMAAIPAPATRPAVEKGVEADVHSIELLDPRRKSVANQAEATAVGGGRYVYGIIQAPATKESISFGRTGIGGFGEQVYSVHHGDIAAVVSKTNVFIFDPTRENALAHEHVIELVMKTHTIIPMSFGTVFRTDDDIREVLKSIYASLKDVLEQMAGKVEFGLKVTWDRDRIIEELKRDDEEIRRFHQELTKKHLQSTYFARMQLGRMIEKTMIERSADFVREIYDGLRSVCVASRDNKPIGDKMIMNAAFLIQREREAAFDTAVNKIAKKFGDRLNFKYTGPWPPYNFVNIRLKLERGTSP